MPRFWPAKVIKNDSQDSDRGEKDGRVQIYIESLMHDIAESDYPWAKPDTAFSSFIPEEDDYVWVWFEDEVHWRHPFYRNKIHIKDYNDAKQFEDEVQSNISDWSSEYPDVKYIYLPNGVCIAMSSSDSTPEITIHHPNAYLHIDSTGNIHIQNVTRHKVDIEELGITIQDVSGLNQVKVTSAGVSLITPDSTLWQPNVLPVCALLPVIPHGGVGAGITQLRGTP